MSNGNSALPLALGAGGGFLLWYFLRDGKQGAAPSPLPPACSILLGPSWLTVDGVGASVAEAVTRCKLTGRARVIATREAPAAAYAELMNALYDAGISAFGYRNGARPSKAKLRTVDDVDLPSFALMVEALAADVEPDPNLDGRARGRFGDRKVFIAAIRRALGATKYRSLPRAAIDELLIRAHRERLLQLARADLVAAMDPDEVRDSEITHGGIAQFHFVVVQPDAARNENTYRAFTLATYTQGFKAGPRLRWFLAEPPTTWADARDRLGAAGILDRTLAGQTRTPGGWMLSVESAHFRDELAKPLPGSADKE